MKKVKMASKDFEYSNLPRNRKEAFFDVFKIHWKMIIVINLILFVAFGIILLPLIFRDSYGVYLTQLVNEGKMTAQDRLVNLKWAHLICAGICIAISYISLILVAGVSRIIRQLVWQEPIFFKDDFVKGIKNNYKIGSICLLIIGAFLLISKLTLLSGDNAIVQSIPTALFLAFILPPTLITYMETTIYEGGFLRFFKNAILIFIKTAPGTLLFTFILVFPLAFAFMDGYLVIKYLCLFLIFLFLSGPDFIIYTLYSHHIFDTFINAFHSPELYKKGLYDPINNLVNKQISSYPYVKFKWVDDIKLNQRVIFTSDVDIKEGFIRLFAADTYQVFFDDEFICYGPNRTAAGYAKERIIKFKDIKNIKVKVIHFDVFSYEVDLQDPYFAIQVFNNDNEIILSTDNFKAYEDENRDPNTPKYSYQRGFVEKYNFTSSGLKEYETSTVIPPHILKESEDKADYLRKEMIFDGENDFIGFESIKDPWWINEFKNLYKEEVFDIKKDFLDVVNKEYKEYNFHLERLSTGFIKLNIISEIEQRIYVVFDEIVNDKMSFGRSNNNELIILDLNVGENIYLSEEPYAFKYLKIISKDNIKVSSSLITLENKDSDFIKYEGDENIIKVLDAAKATYKQSALDIFMDCPGRERAGWLCDSYFTAQGELLFSGKNDIEKDFLTNYLLGKCKEIDSGMVPMCYPSEHPNGRYIPNWSMFLIIELADYFKRTNDKNMINSYKEKVYEIIEFFDRFINEFGLLENLESWVFVEWSICNSSDYLKGVNYPTNMLFAYALHEAGDLYRDEDLINRSEKMKKQIINEAYVDGLFIENSSKDENGNYIKHTDHLSETCQYYALFCNVIPDKYYPNRIVNEFGPLNNKHPEVNKSNVFIGNYLRFNYLSKIKENEKLIEECLQYFLNMAKQTGTLWEKDAPSASCCHGFASSIAVYLIKALTGYEGVKKGSIIYDPDFKNNDKYKLNIICSDSLECDQKSS